MHFEFVPVKADVSFAIPAELTVDLLLLDGSLVALVGNLDQVRHGLLQQVGLVPLALSVLLDFRQDADAKSAQLRDED